MVFFWGGIISFFLLLFSERWQSTLFQTPPHPPPQDQGRWDFRRRRQNPRKVLGSPSTKKQGTRPALQNNRRVPRTSTETFTLAFCGRGKMYKLSCTRNERSYSSSKHLSCPLLVRGSFAWRVQRKPHGPAQHEYVQPATQPIQVSSQRGYKNGSDVMGKMTAFPTQR